MPGFRKWPMKYSWQLEMSWNVNKTIFKLK